MLLLGLDTPELSRPARGLPAINTALMKYYEEVGELRDGQRSGPLGELGQVPIRGVENAC